MLLVGLFVAFDQGLDHQIDGHFVNVFNVLRVAVAQRRLDGIQERIADFLMCAKLKISNQTVTEQTEKRIFFLPKSIPFGIRRFCSGTGRPGGGRG